MGFIDDILVLWKIITKLDDINLVSLLKLTLTTSAGVTVLRIGTVIILKLCSVFRIEKSTHIKRIL